MSTCDVCVSACVHAMCFAVCVLTWSHLRVCLPLTTTLSPQSAVECSGLLRTLHGLEQEQLQRSLALRREEDLARAHRQLALFQRSELHNIFFAQIQSTICRGELQPAVAEALLRDYAEIQVRLVKGGVMTPGLSCAAKVLSVQLCQLMSRPHVRAAC